MVVPPDISCLGDAMGPGFAGRASPDRPNLDDLHALAGDAVAEIELGANMRRWPPAFDEFADFLLDPP